MLLISKLQFTMLAAISVHKNEITLGPSLINVRDVAIEHLHV